MIFKKHGFIEFDYADGKINIKTSSTIIGYLGETHDIKYPFTPSLSMDLNIPLYEFIEPGIYISQLGFKYVLEGRTYKTTLESQEFEVRERD